MSNSNLSKTLLVVPCFNEALRIKTEDFLRFSESGHICFADDGSTDGTSEILKNFFTGHQQISIFRSEVNLGKAGIVRAAVLDMLKRGLPADIEWVGFWDADLATPLTEVELFLRYHQNFAPEAKAIFGSRILRLGAKIERSAVRHYVGRIFATISSVMLGVRCYDSQCGAKLFHRSIVQQIFDESFISRWIFDLEILLRIGEKNILEYPVSEWHDVPGSKVKIFKEVFRVLMDLTRIKMRNY